jgi:hypothetical protein
MKLVARQRYSPPSRSDTLARRRRASASTFSLIQDCGDKRPGSGTPPSQPPLGLRQKEAGLGRLPKKGSGTGQPPEGCLEEAQRHGMAAAGVAPEDALPPPVPPRPASPLLGAPAVNPATAKGRKERGRHQWIEPARPRSGLLCPFPSPPDRLVSEQMFLWTANVPTVPTQVTSLRPWDNATDKERGIEPWKRLPGPLGSRECCRLSSHPPVTTAVT